MSGVRGLVNSPILSRVLIKPNCNKKATLRWHCSMHFASLFVKFKLTLSEYDQNDDDLASLGQNFK